MKKKFLGNPDLKILCAFLVTEPSVNLLLVSQLYVLYLTKYKVRIPNILFKLYNPQYTLKLSFKHTLVLEKRLKSQNNNSKILII